MDKLLQAATFYKDNLENRKFRLVAGKRGKTLEFDIVFVTENFKHLLGLHKLIDLPLMGRNSEIIYRQILNGKTTLSDIEKSGFYNEIKPRLDNFIRIKTTLFGKELMIKSLHGKFNSINADYMLTDIFDGRYAHLFLKGKENSLTVPITFIIHDNNLYLQNNPDKWTILSVTEIEKCI